MKEEENSSLKNRLLENVAYNLRSSYGGEAVAQEEKKGDPFLIAFGLYGAVGFQLAGTVVAGLLFGNWLDKKFDTLPWLTIVGLLFGSVGGFYNLIRILSWKESRKK